MRYGGDQVRSDEYVQFDGLGLADLVRRKAVSPAELVAASQAATAEVDPRINAVRNVSSTVRHRLGRV